CSSVRPSRSLRQCAASYAAHSFSSKNFVPSKATKIVAGTEYTRLPFSVARLCASADAHDLDCLARREVAERRALGEVLLRLNSASDLVWDLAGHGHVAREPRFRVAVLRGHSGDA